MSSLFPYGVILTLRDEHEGRINLACAHNLDPFGIAARMGVKICGMVGAPFEVAFAPGVVVFRWDPDPAVRDARIWAGLVKAKSAWIAPSESGIRKQSNKLSTRFH